MDALDLAVDLRITPGQADVALAKQYVARTTARRAQAVVFRAPSYLLIV